MLKLYYMETETGCGIRASKNPASARSEAIREVGYTFFKSIRLATDEDISYVSAMGGHIPELKLI